MEKANTFNFEEKALLKDCIVHELGHYIVTSKIIGADIVERIQVYITPSRFGGLIKLNPFCYIEDEEKLCLLYGGVVMENLCINKNIRLSYTDRERLSELTKDYNQRRKARARVKKMLEPYKDFVVELAERYINDADITQRQDEDITMWIDGKQLEKDLSTFENTTQE